MYIQYVKDTHDSKKGDIKDINDMQANVLIQLGIAEPYSYSEKSSKTDKKTSKSSKKNEKDDNDSEGN